MPKFRYIFFNFEAYHFIASIFFGKASWDCYCHSIFLPEEKLPLVIAATEMKTFFPRHFH